jgi:hypothetical protein
VSTVFTILVNVYVVRTVVAYTGDACMRQACSPTGGSADDLDGGGAA